MANAKSPDDIYVRLKHYLRYDNWDAGEALLILIGLDPQGTTIAHLSGNMLVVTRARQLLDGKLISDQAERDDLAKKYREILSLWTSGHEDERNHPKFFIDWAHRKGIAIPWLEWASQQRLLPSYGDSGDLSTRERESLLKLVVGMAIGAYGYQPDRVRNDATQEITDDLAKSGVSLDVDTVRKWLKEGAKLLPAARD